MIYSLWGRDNQVAISMRGGNNLAGSRKWAQHRLPGAGYQVHLFCSLCSILNTILAHVI